MLGPYSCCSQRNKIGSHCLVRNSFVSVGPFATSMSTVSRSSDQVLTLTLLAPSPFSFLSTFVHIPAFPFPFTLYFATQLKGELRGVDSKEYCILPYGGEAIQGISVRFKLDFSWSLNLTTEIQRSATYSWEHVSHRACMPTSHSQFCIEYCTTTGLRQIP